MGWLGWTEEQALATDVNAITAAHRGRVAMLRATFGSSEPASGDANLRSESVMSPALYDAVFG